MKIETECFLEILDYYHSQVYINSIYKMINKWIKKFPDLYRFPEIKEIVKRMNDINDSNRDIVYDIFMGYRYQSLRDKLYEI